MLLLKLVVWFIGAFLAFYFGRELIWVAIESLNLSAGADLGIFIGLLIVTIIVGVLIIIDKHLLNQN